MRILIVDDEVIIRKGIIKLLERINRHDFIIDEAQNGKEAFHRIVDQKPDLLITDIEMPIMNGLDLIEKIRLEQIDCEIVILTGYSEFEYVRRALRNSVTDYLLKPVSKSNLEEVITKIFIKNPASWMNEIGQEHIQYINYSAKKFVKAIVSGKRLDIHQTMEELEVYCNSHQFSLSEIKRVMGHLELYYQSEFYQVLDYFPPTLSINHTEGVSSNEQIFTLWFELLLDHLKVVSEKKTPKNKRITEEVIEYIEQNYHDSTLSVKKIADHCGITSAYLSTIFRKAMNQPITQYIIDFRLAKVKERIKTDYITKMNVIAEDCGFNDYPYFSKVFKKVIGISPIEYREKIE